MPNDFINDESELGPNWQPISAAPIVPGRPSAPPVGAATPIIPQFLQGTIAPNFQLDAHFVDTEFRTPAAPKFGLMPLGLQNAVSSSQITSVIKTSGGSGSSTPATVSGLTSVGLAMPSQYDVTNSPLTSNGVIDVSWLPEPNGSFLGVTSVPFAPYPDQSISNGSESASVTSSVTTGSTASNLVFYLASREVSGTGLSSPTGGSWTNIVTAVSSNCAAWYQSGFAANTTVAETATYIPTASPSIVNALVTLPLIGIPVVSVLSNRTATVSSGLTETATVSAGTALISFVFGDMHGHSGTIPDTDVTAITDSNGNLWYQLTSVYLWNGLNHSSFISVWFCPKPAAGSTTFTINFSVAAGTGGNSLWTMVQISNLGPSNNLPTFRYISFSDVQGIAQVGQGGTGSSLVSTGGTHQFLRQNTVGGNVDVVQPDFSDLAGAAGAIAAQYNGVTTQGNGLAAVYKALNLTSQGANIAPSTLLPVTLLAGTYRVSVYLIVSTVASVSSTLPDSQIIFTDRDSNATITINATPGDAGNTTSTFQQATLVINVKASTTIQYAVGQVTAYASSGTAMLFAVRTRVEYLG